MRHAITAEPGAPLVLYPDLLTMARRWAVRHPHVRDELASEAGLIAVEASRGEGRRSPIRYARWLARRRFWDIIASGRRTPPTTLALPVARPCRGLADVEAADAMEAILDRVPPRQAEVLRLVFVNGLSVAEAGRTLGITRSPAHERYRLGLRSARQLLEHDTP